MSAGASLVTPALSLSLPSPEEHTRTAPDGITPRTLNTAARGRPKGFLVAWLRAGRLDCFPEGEAGRSLHCEAAKDCPVGIAPHVLAGLYTGRSAFRLLCRDWARTHLADFPERDRRPGEDEEPSGRP